MTDIVLVKRYLQHSSLLGFLQENYNVQNLWENPSLIFKVGLEEKISGIVTEGFADKELIDTFPNTRVIASFGVGFDGIDVDYATQKGIQVTNTPDVLTDDVADMAIMLMLAASRGLCVGDRLVRQGEFEKGFKWLTQNVYSKKLGILGMGRIGQAIARRAEAFRLHVSYHGPREKPGLVYPYYSNLNKLAEDSDFLIVSCPGGEATRMLVSRSVMEALGTEGILINISRGTVIDESAMVELLKNGELGGAGLDVFENEPHVPQELLTMDNVVLQPHRGSATVQTRIAMGQLVLDNLEAFFAGKPVPNPVNQVLQN